MHHSSHPALVNHDVVQDERLGAAPAFAVHDFGEERKPPLGDIRLADEGLEGPLEGVGRGGREEPDAAEVHAEDRRVGAIQAPRPP